MTIAVSYTINMENATVVLPFVCSTAFLGDCQYVGNGSMPFVNSYFPILSGNLYRDLASSAVAGLFYLVVPSSVPLYPYTTFPTDAFILQSDNLLHPSVVLEVPDCHYDSALTNTSKHIDDASKIFMQDAFGANLSAGVLRTRQFLPLSMTVPITDPYVFSWLELEVYIPQRNFTALFSAIGM